MMLMHNKTYLVSKIIPCFVVTIRNKCHYDVLGITPKATQNDIKSAYYKLSKIHHPDKSKGEESAKMFRAITEAYEVLGNVQLKKMYDKGLLVRQENTSRVDYHPEEEPTDPSLRFHKSRSVRNIVPTMDGKTPIYDFDTWSKQHYGNLLHKSQRNREILQSRREKKIYDQQATKQEFFIYTMFTVVILFTALVTYGQSDYDKDEINKENKEITKES